MTYDIVSERNAEKVTVTWPDDAVVMLRRYARKRQEHFLVITLKGNHTVSRVRIVSIGLANRALVHPREIFYPAILDNATAVLLAHNHPSGQCQPSEEDLSITKRMVDAGHLLGIPVLDHIIVGVGKHFSFVEAGVMP